MNKQTEQALKMAIEALSKEGWIDTDSIINACKEALESQEKEPSFFGWYDNHDIHYEKQTDDSIPLYTNPAPEPECSNHPDAPHGFCRNASHSAGRYVCKCEGWEAEKPAQEPVGKLCLGCGTSMSDERLAQEALEMAASVISSINEGKQHLIVTDDDRGFFQREEWVRWAIDEVLPQIKEALAQPAQEPVGYIVPDYQDVMRLRDGYTLMAQEKTDLHKVAVYTHPAPSCSCKDKK